MVRSVFRAFSTLNKGLRPKFPARSFTTSTTSSISNHPFVSKLLHGSISGVKAALDSSDASIIHANDNASFWESLLSSINSSSPHKAQLVLEWKLEKLMKEDERDQKKYSELIALCGRVRNISFAMKVFNLIEAHGMRPTSTIFNSLIFACLCSGNLITAISLFEIMDRSENCKPNLASYNAFVTHYSKLGDSKSMSLWYSASKEAGFAPNIQTYESLIAGSIKSKQINDANKFYEEMMLSGVTPSTYIMENMIELLCQERKIVRTKQFVKFLLNGSWSLNGKTMKKLLHLYSELAGVEEMEELLKVFISSKQDSEVLLQVHLGIIRMYAMLDRLDDMEFSIGRMLMQGQSFTCSYDVEKIISSYFRRSAHDRLELFLERIHGSYKFPRSTYDLIIAGYERAGLHEKLDMMKAQMLDIID
ncbi:hypothetical protein Sjap_011430 [Stephania japonica]|uniref:PROP1-like PPR domain-containing protein n=1 Tax=Stephania japonica TaxID=461633 RepID=A0AAP0P511_9MAGN